MTGRLSRKLIFSLVATLGVSYVYLGYRITDIHRRDLEEVTFAAADRISDSIKRSIHYSMQLNHREHIYHTIKTIGGEPGLNKVRLFNEVGKISFSSDDREIATYVDKDAEACYACHSQEEPLRRLERPDRRRVFFDENGNRYVGVINAIENEPGCYNADCHAHSPEQQVLGVLDVSMSLQHVDQVTREGRNWMLLQLTLAALIAAGVLSAFLWRSVLRPIRHLIVGTERVAEGRLDYRAAIESNDEIGLLCDSFNRMTEQLEQARKELTDWAQTLETRVEEKASALKRAHDQMVQVERMASMGKLAAIVAHEINNPLTGILTSARLVQKRLLKKNEASDSDTLEHIQMIADEAGRCGEIVKNLLQFARPQSHEPKPADINQIIRDCVRLVAHKMNLLGLEAKLNLDDSLPPVTCDAQGLKQALVAILINACEATGSGGGEIQLGSLYMQDRQMVRFWVADNGCGMDEQTRERMFEPFFTTKEEVKGVGLGMAVVSGIVRAHRGEIEVESRKGVGTKVTILLPTGEDVPNTGQTSGQVDPA